MKCRHCRVIGCWPPFQHRKPLLLFSARSLLCGFAHKPIRAAGTHQGGKRLWLDHQGSPIE
jgi:hypothetical protein